MQSLHKKYSRLLPRYTSYPPATYFHSNFTAQDYREELIASNRQQPEHISIYIHVPFCPQLCHYCGCNALKTNSREIITSYAEALLNELKLIFPLLSKTRKITQIHFGGGTPTSLPMESIQSIIRYILDSFDSVEQTEIAIECHPAYLDHIALNGLKKAGFNRISLGIQDFDPTVLKMVNRRPSHLPVKEIITFIHNEMNASVNLDFIYGLPGQTPETFLESIKTAVGLSPDRLVAFPYTHLPQLFRRQSVLEKQGLPSAENKLRMFELATDYLSNNNYLQVGMDHFVLADDELWKAKEEKQLHRNFQGYCSRKTTGQVYAFGMSGISQLGSCYAQNTKDIPAYLTAIGQKQLPVEKGYKLNEREQIAREIISSLMCNYRIDWSEIAFRTGRQSAGLKEQVWSNEKELASLQQDGIIGIEENKILVTEAGKPFVRNIAVCFDPLYSN